MPLTKLTPQTVLDIRQEWARGGITMKALALKYSIHRGHVSRVINGKTWLSSAAVRLSLQKVFNDARR